MFEANTYEKLMKDVLAAAPPGIDTRQGSIFFDAVSATVNKIARLYSDLDRVFKLVFIMTAEGEYLGLRAAEFSITRRGATGAKYLFKFTGTEPKKGWRFFHNDSGYYFTLGTNKDGALILEAETEGVACNDIQDGDIAVPVDTVQGMASANFGAVYEYGTEQESDDSLRARVLEKISGYAANGNKQHYKTWCESVEGVGKARIRPLWNGENTVKGILISPLGLPVSDDVVAAVQQYIDPCDEGVTVTVEGKTYNVGDGKGNGVANVGAHFTAVSAEAYTVNLSFTAEPVAGQTAASIRAAVRARVEEYLQELATTTGDGTALVIRINAIGAILSSMTGHIIDYSALTLNGAAQNITINDDAAPVLGEVAVNVVP